VVEIALPEVGDLLKSVHWRNGKDFCFAYRAGLPEVAESTWLFNSIFHSEPVLASVRSKDESATGTRELFKNKKPKPYTQ
jgi:hypothetical protein